MSGVDLEFSVGFTMTVAVGLAQTAWTQAINADGSPRAGADVAELTGVLGDLTAAGWPSGMRVIVRDVTTAPGIKQCKSRSGVSLIRRENLVPSGSGLPVNSLPRMLVVGSPALSGLHTVTILKRAPTPSRVLTC